MTGLDTSYLSHEEEQANHSNTRQPIRNRPAQAGKSGDILVGGASMYWSTAQGTVPVWRFWSFPTRTGTGAWAPICWMSYVEPDWARPSCRISHTRFRMQPDQTSRFSRIHCRQDTQPACHSGCHAGLKRVARLQVFAAQTSLLPAEGTAVSLPYRASGRGQMTVDVARLLQSQVPPDVSGCSGTDSAFGTQSAPHSRFRT